jgi:hypothetical protein
VDALKQFDVKIVDLEVPRSSRGGGTIKIDDIDRFGDEAAAARRHGSHGLAEVAARTCVADHVALRDVSRA